MAIRIDAVGTPGQRAFSRPAVVSRYNKTRQQLGPAGVITRYRDDPGLAVQTVSTA